MYMFQLRLYNPALTWSICHSFNSYWAIQLTCFSCVAHRRCISEWVRWRVWQWRNNNNKDTKIPTSNENDSRLSKRKMTTNCEDKKKIQCLVWKKLNNFVDSSARKGVKSVLPIRKLLIFCQNGECCAENVVYVGFEQEINAS